MFARLTTLQFKIDGLDEATRIYEENIIPVSKKQKGFRGAYLLLDRKTGKAVAITLWDSEADAIANEQSGYYQEQVVKHLEFFAAPPIREGYEVVTRA